MNLMKNSYIKPEAVPVEIALEGTAMLAQSEYDEKHNTERLGWDDVIDL